MNELTVGMLGFGQVGRQVSNIIKKNQQSQNISLALIGVRDIYKNTDGTDREHPGAVFLSNLDFVIKNESVNVIVEALNDTKLAKEYIIKAIFMGKPVISCSKDVWVKHRDELAELAKDKGVPLYLNSLVATSESNSVFDYLLNQDTIQKTDMYKATRFYGADGYITAQFIIKDLELALKDLKKKLIEEEIERFGRKDELGSLGFTETYFIYNNLNAVADQKFVVSDERPVFLFNASSHSLYHIIIEELGQALYLKNQFPDIKIYANYTALNGKSPLALSLLEMFDIFEFMPFNIEQYSKIEIPRLAYYAYGNNPLLLDVLGKTNSRNYSQEFWHAALSPILRNFFKKFRAPAVNPNLKIYIKLDPSKYRQDGRSYNPEDVARVEKFFIDNGFIIFDPMSVSLTEQIYKISEAQTVASLSGSNSTHSIWTSESSTFFLMNLGSKSYNFPHGDLIENNCRLEFLNDDVEDLIKKLSTNYASLL